MDLACCEFGWKDGDLLHVMIDLRLGSVRLARCCRESSRVAQFSSTERRREMRSRSALSSSGGSVSVDGLLLFNKYQRMILRISIGPV